MYKYCQVIKYRNDLGLEMRKPVFGVSDKVKLNPVSATEIGWYIETLHVASYTIILPRIELQRHSSECADL